MFFGLSLLIKHSKVLLNQGELVIVESMFYVVKTIKVRVAVNDIESIKLTDSKFNPLGTLFTAVKSRKPAYIEIKSNGKTKYFNLDFVNIESVNKIIEEVLNHLK